MAVDNSGHEMDWRNGSAIVPAFRKQVKDVVCCLLLTVSDTRA